MANASRWSRSSRSRRTPGRTAVAGAALRVAAAALPSATASSPPRAAAAPTAASGHPPPGHPPSSATTAEPSSHRRQCPPATRSGSRMPAPCPSPPTKTTRSNNLSTKNLACRLEFCFEFVVACLDCTGCQWGGREIGDYIYSWGGEDLCCNRSGFVCFLGQMGRENSRTRWKARRPKERERTRPGHLAA